jgi:hypothetical protein
MPKPILQVVALGLACAASFVLGSRHGADGGQLDAALARRLDALETHCSAPAPVLNESRLLADVRRTVREELESVAAAAPAPAPAAANANAQPATEPPHAVEPRTPEQERAFAQARRTLDTAKANAHWGEAEVVVFRDALARLDAEDIWEVRGEFIRAANSGLFQVDVDKPF